MFEASYSDDLRTNTPRLIAPRARCDCPYVSDVWQQLNSLASGAKEYCVLVRCDNFSGLSRDETLRCWRVRTIGR